MVVVGFPAIPLLLGSTPFTFACYTLIIIVHDDDDVMMMMMMMTARARVCVSAGHTKEDLGFGDFLFYFFWFDIDEALEKLTEVADIVGVRFRKRLMG